jgi:hypothetical protein
MLGLQPPCGLQLPVGVVDADRPRAPAGMPHIPHDGSASAQLRSPAATQVGAYSSQTARYRDT